MDPLLLIHGTGGDASTWDAVAPLLAERYRVIAYDRRGYGRPHAAHAEDARAILAEPPLWMRSVVDVRMTLGMLPLALNLVVGRRRAATAAFFRAVTRYRDGGSGFDALSAAERARMLSHADDVLGELRIGTGEELSLLRLGMIACPTTLLLGARSAPIFARQAARLAAAMRRLRTVTLDGAGHLMMREQPAAFVRAIIEADRAPLSSPAA